ncbi:kinase [Saccharopolyspora sp. NPDC002686]|uniref:kinase n=1 Tax=Saccharopolyspora sp. NPDC002686 TaxID=3154541 RepID=UPI003316B3D9
MGLVGSSRTRLVVIRGNSGSGKSSVATAVREALGRTCALVPQDVMRRTVLKERDVANGFNIGLISTVARYALDCGYHVIVEGILTAQRYATMLTQLARDHRGTTAFYYLDVSFEETLRRHETRPKAAEFGPEEMRAWYREHDVLRLPSEQVIPETSSLEQTTHRILAEAFGEQPRNATKS